ncbi:MAG: preprotein translocase subunit YajC [Bacteroidota bacterium]
MSLILQAGGAGATNMLFFLAMIGIFFFMILLPQRKRSREQKSFMASLEKGMQVVTSSGILGRINKIDEQIVTLEVDTKTFIQVTRNAISKELTDAVYATKSA